METSTRDATGCITSPWRWNLWHRAVVPAARLSLMVATVCAAGWVATIWWAVLEGPPSVSRTIPDVEQSAAASPPPLSMLKALPPGGHWTVEGVTWKVGSVRVSEADVAARLESVPAARLETGTSVEEQELLARVRQLPVRRKRSGNVEMLEWDAGELRICLLVSGAGPEERLLAARLVCFSENGTAEVIEAIPLTASLTLSHGAASLISWPDGSHRWLARWDEAGRLLCEVVTVDLPLPVLQDRWREAHWSIERPQWIPDHGGNFLCTRGADVLHVWAIRPAAGADLVVLCVRSPDG